MPLPVPVPPAPELPELPLPQPDEPDEPEEPEEPLLPEPLPAPVLPLALLLSVPVVPLSRKELHADRPNANASKPVSNTLWCCRFMFNSLYGNGVRVERLALRVRDDAACHSGKRHVWNPRSS